MLPGHDHTNQAPRHDADRGARMYVSYFYLLEPLVHRLNIVLFALILDA